ncbi:Maleylacetate reductase [Methylobacterium crusticola]|uniref:Maleylacetate reductase n=1 Tax=Methylobacterium crusticola TaxID=1697972 RepID=A0ABQ4QZG2_9HYPH|nr:maleylacetate reductase [Methylobacterium crusticola]GJD50031.1 Maleylacetate reductase [Methylobacterium crusticola]
MARSPFRLPGGVYNAVPPRIVFGPGAVAEVADAVARHGARRALVLSTPGRGALAERVRDLLGAACVGILPEAVSQVPIELARRGRERARAMGADCLVTVGGGAAIGLGKGIALELPLPIVAIPTTYSGSEMTGFCGITIDGVKRMHASLNMLAGTVIYDPELSLPLPLDVSAASALNALAHCIDGIYVPTVSPVMALAAVEGARVLMEALPRVSADPGDLAARTDLLYGAYLGGAALTGGFALQHGVAHVLGGSFGIAHGLSHALVLPHVAAYNQRFAAPQLAPLAATVGDGNLGGAIFDILVEAGLPTSLREIGLPRESLERAAAITVETDNGLNPAPVTIEAVRRILDDAHEGRRPA